MNKTKLGKRLWTPIHLYLWISDLFNDFWHPIESHNGRAVHVNEGVTGTWQFIPYAFVTYDSNDAKHR